MPMPMHQNWDEFLVPDCPNCKTSEYVEEISMPGAFICRLCGTTMMEDSKPEGKSDGKRTVSSKPDNPVPPDTRSPVLGRMEEENSSE